MTAVLASLSVGHYVGWNRNWNVTVFQRELQHVDGPAPLRCDCLLRLSGAANKSVDIKRYQSPGAFIYLKHIHACKPGLLGKLRDVYSIRRT
jgi:hypothetical protein